MKVNKSLLAVLSMFLILLLFVSSASAADANDTEVLSVDDSPNIIGEDKILTDTNEPSFMALQVLIWQNNDINLDMNYKAVKGSGQVLIESSKTINGNGHTIDASDKCGIFEITGGNVVLNDIVFKNGKFGRGGAIQVSSADSLILNNVKFINCSSSVGGAICIDTDSLTFEINNCTFEGNLADALGGAIFSKSKLTISNSTFKKNIAADNGGAIDISDTLTVDNCSFIDNSLINGDYGPYADTGGAIQGTYINIVNSYFEGNSAVIDGGAIYSTRALSVKNTTFKNNKADGATYSQCYGGAIRSEDDVKVDNCTFIGNHAYDNGGAIYAETVTWVNDLPSYFIGNYVDDNCGGAIYTNKFNTDIYYGVFINNTAKANDDGGAIYINEEYHGKIALCYFENNRCGDEGGAIYTDSMSSSLKFLNNIFIDNDAGDKGDIVYNSGYYDAIAFNWFGINNPNFDNKFKEYHAIGYDEDHADGYPVHAKLLLDDNCEVGKEYNLTVYFEDGKGNHAILPCDLININITADNNAKISDWHKVSECTYVTGITFTNTNVTHITANVNHQVLELDVLATVNDFQHRHENASNSANVVTNNDYNVDNNGNTNLFSVISNVENADYTNSSNKTPNNSSVAKTIGNQSNGSGFNYLWVLLLIVIFAGAGVLIKQYKN